MSDKTWTMQSIFDHVSKHLIEQNAKAMKGTYCCGFNPETKMRCAAGCLIPIEEWEKMDAEEHKKGYEFVYPYVFFDNEDDNFGLEILIKRLQGIHDGYPVEEWKIWLKDLGIEFNLTIPEWLKGFT